MFNCVIGAGIFGLPGRAFSLSGALSILAIFLCAVLTLIIVLNFAEVGSKFKSTGGNYLYTLKIFGRYPGFINGWLASLARITAYAALINLLVDYLGYFSEWFDNFWIRSLTIFGITLWFYFINLRGVKSSAVFNNITGVTKLIPLLIFVVVGLFFIDLELVNFSAPLPAAGDFSTTILILVFAFTGFEGGVVNTGEMKNPSKDIPFALIFSLFFIAIFYMLIQFVSIGVFPGLASSNRPLADAAAHVFGAFGGVLITIGAILSISGTLNVNVLAGSRLAYAMSKENQFPSILKRTNLKTGIPFISLFAYMLISLIVSVSGTFIYALSITVIIRIIVYIFVCAALIKMRYSRVPGVESKGYNNKYGYLTGAFGIMLCVWLLYTSDISTFIEVIVVIAIGVAFYILFKNNPFAKAAVKKANPLN